MRTMYRFWLVGAIAVFSLSLAASPARAIVNGSADGNDHPNVGIVYFNDRYVFAVGFCSGSLLSPREFLTAGHCTAGFTALGVSPSQLNVSFDSELSFSEGLVVTTAHPIAVEGWTTHPGFKTSAGGSVAAQTIANDVGVIHLAEEVDAPAIDLPDVGLLDAEAAQGGLLDHVFVNVGYGFNSLDRALWGPNVNAIWEARRTTSSAAFMALTPNHLQEQGGVCGGDSGGPVFYAESNSNLVVATIVAADDRCGSLAVDQRLDTKAVLDFLETYR